MHTITVGKHTIGGNKLVLVAGPCIIESADHAHMMARQIQRIAKNVGIPYVFKASYDKANRSSIDSFRGPGLEKGLEILRDIKQDTGLPVTTDLHEPSQAPAVAAVADLLQIPAFLCRQTDLLVAAARTDKPVNIKKGQFLAPWDMRHVAEKVSAAGGKEIMLTERGASFGYNNLVCDFRSLGIMKSLGYPVMLDVTHSLQLPGGQGSSSGGNREFVLPLARAGVAFGVDALFLEVHDRPDEALSDGPNSLALADLEPLLEQICKIREVLS